MPDTAPNNAGSTPWQQQQQNGSGASAPGQPAPDQAPSAPPFGAHNRKGSFSQYLSPPTSTNSQPGCGVPSPSPEQLPLLAPPLPSRFGPSSDTAPVALLSEGQPFPAHAQEQAPLVPAEYYTSYSAVLGEPGVQTRGAVGEEAQQQMTGPEGNAVYGVAAVQGQPHLQQGAGTAVLFAQSADELSEVEL